MANETISPNMSLPIPGVGLTTGPQWATDLDGCMTLIDQHDHTAGKGVLITPSALNINTDLPLNSNNATLIRSLRFSAQGSPLSLSTDRGCLYESGVDLYYNDGSGNQIRITQSGSISGTSGTIGGLTSPASATYVSATPAFVFQSAASTSALLDAGSVIIRNQTLNSYGLTLAAPTLSSNYTVTLPALPAQTNVMTIGASGSIGSVTWNNVAENRTRSVGSSVGLGGVAVSGPFTQSVTGNTFVAITGASCTLTTSGRPVQFHIGPNNNNTTGSNIGIPYGAEMVIIIYRGATATCRMQIQNPATSAGQTMTVPPITMIDTNVPAGTYTWTIQICDDNNTGRAVFFTGMLFTVLEL